MFCGECGAKNNIGDRFCQECGKPLEQVEIQNNTTNQVVKVKQPMSKKNKIIIAVLVSVIAILGVGYKIGSDMTSPKAVAEDYVKAVVSNDSDKLYKHIEFDGDTTFVSKKIFKELLGNLSGDEGSKIENFKVTKITYGDEKLTAEVEFSYTVKGSADVETDSVELIKGKEKKFFIFDDWKIADLSSESLTMKDYKIKVTKGSTLTFSEVKLTDKYLSKEESTSELDVYVLPLVFTTSNPLKVVLPSGLEIEEEVTPSSYRSTYTVTFDEDNLSQAVKDKIVTKSKEILVDLYTNAIAKKQFSEIKSKYEHNGLDLTTLESDYNSFVAELSSSSNTLNSIDFTNVSLYDIGLDSKGNLEVELKVNYNYSVTYTNWSNEVETHNDTDYDYMTIILALDKDNYYLVGIDDLEDYFSRY